MARQNHGCVPGNAGFARAGTSYPLILSARDGMDDAGTVGCRKRRDVPIGGYSMI